MAKVDKEFQARMGGMLYALNIAREKGIDGLDMEIKKRGYTRAPLSYTDTQVEEFIHYICSNTRETVFALALYVLNEDFGFGEQRLSKFVAGFNKLYNDCLDLDYMGNHYVKMEDFAVELKEKYHKLIIDIDRIATAQDAYDKGVPNRTKTVDSIINTLSINGYEEAAEYLEKRKNESFQSAK